MTVPPLILLVSLLLPAGGSPVPQEPEAASPEVESELPACHAVPAGEPGDLDESASDKERWLLEIHRAAAESSNALLGAGNTENFRRLTEEARASGIVQLVQGPQLALAHSLMVQGDLRGAIEQYEGFVELMEADGSFPDTARAAVYLVMAMAYFRLAEQQNCIARHSQESCIFPLRGKAVHVDREGATKAANTLARVLELDPDYVEAEWLLNVAHMALGSWPDEVPEEHLFAPRLFEPEQRVGLFLDVAPRLGLNRHTRAGGVVVDDFDGDGRLDVLSSSMDTGTGLRLMLAGEDGAFVDATESAGLGAQLGGVALVHGDVNGDGLLDVLVLRGGWLFREGTIPDSLLLQVEPGVFRDVTAEAGIEFAAPTRCGALADMDDDGDLDLFLGLEAVDTAPDEGYQPFRLFANDGSGRFEDVSAGSGIAIYESCVDAAFGDANGDGLPDLYVSILDGANRLYRNEGDATFTDVAAEQGVVEPGQSGSVAFLDADNDGDLDLLVAYYGQYLRARSQAAWFRDGSILSGTPRFYENDGSGGFRDATESRGLRRVSYALGMGYGDLDGDGFPDLYLGTGAVEMSALWPNLMYRNDGGRRFQDVTTSAQVGHLQKTSGVAFADHDGDGDQDLFLQVGGFHLDDGFADVVFENPGHSNRWLEVRLEGVRSNRYGVGARVRARVRESDGERDVYSVVGARGSRDGAPLRAWLGLGAAEAIVELEVVWPGAGGRQAFEDVPLDASITVRQGQGDLRVAAR